MAEISEVFDNVADNTKKLFKNKAFVIALVGVAGVALYVALTKSKSEEAEEATAYGAVGYAGYPVTGGGGGSEYVGSVDADYLAAVEEVVNSNTAYYESVLNATTAEQNEQIATLSNRLITSEETIAKQQADIQRQNDIAQMKANSELHGQITDRATKDALHAENLAIAERNGWTFDTTTYNYFDSNGNVVYLTSKQEAAALGTTKTTTTTTKTAAPATSTYTNNATYTAAKQNAATSGTTATTPKTTTTSSTAKQTTSVNAGLSGGQTGSGNYGGTVVATTASGLKIYSSSGSSSSAVTANTTKNISSTSSKSGTATAGKLI